MNILILTVGSLGDVQPYVALGKGLKAAGHAVTLCTSMRFESLVVEHGLDYAYLNDDLINLLESATGRGALEDMGNFFSGIKTVVTLIKRTGPIQRALLWESWTAARDVNPDLIVYSSKMGGAVHFAEKLGIPVVLAVLFPQLVPTKKYPSIGFPPWKLGGWYNKLTYRIVLAIAGRIGRGYIDEWRSAQELPAASRANNLLHRHDGTPIPVLHGYSRHVVPEPTDWPPSATTTGYWFLDRSANWKPPERLEKFLASGEPPVYVGYGSMAGRDPSRVTRIVIEALQQARLRGVLATGWGGLTPGALPQQVFALQGAPHDWLFPRMAAVVHHGGAGTTSAGLRAGRPAVICPFFGDQPFWGRRVYELGVGSAPIPQSKLTSPKLAAALREVTEDHEIQRRANALAALLKREDGVAAAVATIDQIFNNR